MYSNQSFSLYLSSKLLLKNNILTTNYWLTYVSFQNTALISTHFKVTSTLNRVNFYTFKMFVSKNRINKCSVNFRRQNNFIAQYSCNKVFGKFFEYAIIKSLSYTSRIRTLMGPRILFELANVSIKPQIIWDFLQQGTGT